MPIGPTFAPGYLGPGVFPKVIFENRPPAVTPPFITALIGRTSIDKLKIDELVRNDVAAQTVTVDPITGLLSVASGDVDETIRRDILLVDDTDVTVISGEKQVLTIEDNETFTEFSKGFDKDWVATNVTLKLYVEWIIDYNVKATGTDPIFVGKAGSASFIVQLARAAGDPIFTAAPPVTIADGAHTISGGFELVVSGTATVFTLALDGGTGVDVTIGGQFTITSGVGGDIEVFVDATAMLATFPIDGTFENNTTVVTRGPRIGSGVDPLNAQTIGSRYKVTYRTKKELSDFTPAIFDNTASLQQFHGAVSVNSKNDDLSIGAVPYFLQGGQTVFAVPLKDKLILGATDGFDLDEPTGSGYVSAVQDALTQLEDVANVSLVIPLSPTEPIAAGNFRPGILSNVLSHINKTSTVSEANPRMTILGARAGTVTENIFTTAASTANSNRVVYLAPATATLTTGGITKVVDGSLIAAAIAGILSSGQDAGEPISGKQITVFDDIPDPFTKTQKNRMAGIFGLSIIQKDNGASIVRHFLTTDPSTTLLSEGKVTVIEIDIRRSIKIALTATVINQRNVDGQTIGLVRAILTLALNQKRAAQVINDFTIVKIERDPSEARQINVEVNIQPTLDVNWIFVEAKFQTG